MRASIDGDDYRTALTGMIPSENPEIISAFLKRAALDTAGDAAANRIKRGGKGPPVAGRLTSRTGTGRRSIGVNLSNLPRSSEAGSNLGYMAAHEFGGSIGVQSTTVQEHIRSVAFGRRVAPFKVPSYRRSGYSYHLPARPWLKPAVDAFVIKAPGIAAKMWEDATRLTQGSGGA